MARPSGSRTIGQPTTSTGKDEVGGHPPDHRELLEVLLAEVGAARAGDGEELGHDRGHPGEVRGPGRALHRLAEARRRRRWCRTGSGYISSCSGLKSRSTPARLGLRPVPLAGPGDRTPGPRPGRTAAGSRRWWPRRGRVSARAAAISDRCPSCRYAHRGHQPDRAPPPAGPRPAPTGRDLVATSTAWSSRVVRDCVDLSLALARIVDQPARPGRPSPRRPGARRRGGRRGGARRWPSRPGPPGR